jgi:PhoH-like ATPase
MAAEKYTGYREFSVSSEVIDALHKNKIIEVWDKRLGLTPNLYLELKDISNEKHTALAKVLSDGRISKLEPRTASGIKPRNREQVFALDALLDDNIKVVVLTGKAGTGKSYIVLAAALQKIEEAKYKKVVLTRPMSEVGKYKLGALPGGLDEKFGPYLLNYTTNLEQFTGSSETVQDLLDQSKFEMVPIQLMRGASFTNCLLIADEIQILPPMEILTIGSRIGEGSKIVICGDLQQRDEHIAKEKTGLYKMINDKTVKDSPLAAVVELTQIERGPVARLFCCVFEDVE